MATGDQSHACLARIVDREDSRWDPTISWGGGHKVTDSYGLGQADPGTKTAVYTYTFGIHHAGEATGAAWATSMTIQWSWSWNYAGGRYGSPCAAWDHWQANSGW